MLLCPGCGVLWQPVDRRQPGAPDSYDETYYHAWGDLKQARAVKMATFDRYLQALEKHLQPGNLLDVGCAMGYLLEAASLRGWEPFGVELSAHAAELAKERFGAERIYCGALQDASFAPGTFRAITLTDVLEHLPDPAGSLQICHGLLEPGGCLLLVTPRVGSLSQRILGRGWFQFKHEHLQLFTLAALRTALESAGFRIVGLGAPAKTLSLNYLAHYCRAYPTRILTPALNLLERAAGPLARVGIGLRTGEQLVIARRD